MVIGGEVFKFWLKSLYSANFPDRGNGKTCKYIHIRARGVAVYVYVYDPLIRRNISPERDTIKTLLPSAHRKQHHASLPLTNYTRTGYDVKGLDQRIDLDR